MTTPTNSDELVPTKAHSRNEHASRFGVHTYRIRTTRNDLNAAVGLPDRPDDFPTCSYCGSLSPTDMLRVMQMAGTKYSGSDWKYGWPHKFYVEVPCEPHEYAYSGTYRGNNGPENVQTTTRTRMYHKFYSEHLLDATPEQLAEWTRVVTPLLGVDFFVNERGGLSWRAPHNFQASGTV